jgi:hypothetical protein
MIIRFRKEMAIGVFIHGNTEAAQAKKIATGILSGG